MLTLQELAKIRGGECLSLVYTGCRTKYQWKCKNGHIWAASYSSVKQKTWCPECSLNRKRLTIKDCYELAHSKMGTFLSEEYIDNETRYQWRCGHGHIWSATLAHVKSGTWCPECAGYKKKTIEDCFRLAKSKNGGCLSTNYINSKTKYEWQCVNDHKWLATYDNVKAGHWCPECVGLKRKTAEDCHALAAEKKGKFLSKEYFNSKVKYLWQCEKGHIWKATRPDIDTGYWCPKCVTNKRAQTELYEFVKSICPDAEDEVDGLLPSKNLRFDVYIPSLKKAIELDGEYWHSQPEAVERDFRKITESKVVGIKLLAVPYKGMWFRNNRPLGEKAIREFLGV